MPLAYEILVAGSSKHIIYFWQGCNSTIEEKGASALLTTKVDMDLSGMAIQVLAAHLSAAWLLSPCSLLCRNFDPSHNSGEGGAKQGAAALPAALQGERSAKPLFLSLA